MVVFTPVDVLQHRFWRFMDKEHQRMTPALAEICGNAIVEGYTQVDQAIGEILQMPERRNSFCASDHGFTPVL